jgi:hypothetical protein
MKSNTLNHDDIRRTWAAMQKSAHDEPLSEKEWNALSWSRWLVAQRQLPGANSRRLRTEAERADNLAFYKSLGAPCRGASVIH